MAHDLNSKQRRELMNRLLVAFRWKCSTCRKLVSRDLPQDHPDRATVDHIVPRSKGGLSDDSNVRLMCFECNQRRDNGCRWMKSPESLESRDAGRSHDRSRSKSKQAP